jgi:hypothetical protein
MEISSKMANENEKEEANQSNHEDNYHNISSDRIYNKKSFDDDNLSNNDNSSAISGSDRSSIKLSEINQSIDSFANNENLIKNEMKQVKFLTLNDTLQIIRAIFFNYKCKFYEQNVLFIYVTNFFIGLGTITVSIELPLA